MADESEFECKSYIQFVFSMTSSCVFHNKSLKKKEGSLSTEMVYVLLIFNVE